MELENSKKKFLSNKKKSLEQENSFVSYLVYSLMIVFILTSFFALYSYSVENKPGFVFYIICIATFFGLSIIQLFRKRLEKIIKI